MERRHNRRRTRLATLVAAGSLLAGMSVTADEVYLRGGGRLSGVVVERTESTLVLETPPGRIGVPLSRIERVVSGPSALSEYRRRAARLEPQDVAGWLALAVWARDQGLATSAREAAEHIVALDPSHEAAQRLLGRVPLDGRWLSPDDARRAQGLVPFEGEWVTPAERAELLRGREESAAAARARAEADARAREAEARAREAEADARRAESEARQAEEGSDGIPLWLGGGGVIWPPRDCNGRGCEPHGEPHGDGGGTTTRPPEPRPRKPQPLVGGSDARPKPRERSSDRINR